MLSRCCRSFVDLRRTKINFPLQKLESTPLMQGAVPGKFLAGPLSISASGQPEHHDTTYLDKPSSLGKKIPGDCGKLPCSKTPSSQTVAATDNMVSHPSKRR